MAQASLDLWETLRASAPVLLSFSWNYHFWAYMGVSYKYLYQSVPLNCSLYGSNLFFLKKFHPITLEVTLFNCLFCLPHFCLSLNCNKDSTISGEWHGLQWFICNLFTKCSFRLPLPLMHTPQHCSSVCHRTIFDLEVGNMAFVLGTWQVKMQPLSSDAEMICLI